MTISIDALAQKVSAFLSLLSEINAFATSEEGHAKIGDSDYTVEEVVGAVQQYQEAYSEFSQSLASDPDNLPGTPDQIAEQLDKVNHQFYGVALDISLKPSDSLKEEVKSRFEKLIGLQRQIVAFIQSPEGQAKIKAAIAEAESGLTELASAQAEPTGDESADAFGDFFGSFFSSMVPKLADLLESLLESASEMIPELQEQMESIDRLLIEGSLKPSQLFDAKETLDKKIKEAEEQIKLCCTADAIK